MTDPSPSLEEQRHAHWDAAYRSRVPELMTWYQERPERSLSFIAGAGLDSSTTVVDVGGGSSPLVDHLFDRGFTNLTVLDVSPVAMGHAQQRLGDRAGLVTWVEGDGLEYEFNTPFDVWHDRTD